MKHFVTDSLLLGVQLPHDYAEEMGQHQGCSDHGSLVETIPTPAATNASLTSQWQLTSDITLPSYNSTYVLKEIQLQNLRKLFAKLCSVQVSSIQAGSCTRKYTSVQMHGKQVGSYRSRSNSSSIVMAEWTSDICDLLWRNHPYAANGQN